MIPSCDVCRVPDPTTSTLYILDTCGHILCKTCLNQLLSAYMQDRGTNDCNCPVRIHDSIIEICSVPITPGVLAASGFANESLANAFVEVFRDVKRQGKAVAVKLCKETPDLVDDGAVTVSSDWLSTKYPPPVDADTDRDIDDGKQGDLDDVVVKVETLREQLDHGRQICLKTKTPNIPRGCYLLKYNAEFQSLTMLTSPRPSQMCSALFPDVRYVRVKFSATKGRPSRLHLLRYSQFLQKGFGEYEFFTYTNRMTQNRARDCIMVHRTAIDQLKQQSGLAEVNSVQKFIKYSGLLFNELEFPVQRLQGVLIELNNDLKRHGFLFTDGCGGISEDLVQELVPNRFPVPSALQIRAPGIKGVLAVDPRLPKRTIRFRHSMQKLDILKLGNHFGAMDLPIAVLGYSKWTRCSGLNNQVIALLLERGLNPKIVIERDKRYKNAVKNALTDVNAALDFLYIAGYDKEFCKLANILNFHYAKKPALERFWFELRAIQSRELSLWKRTKSRHPGRDPQQPEESERMIERRVYLPIRQSRNLFGVCDELGVLPRGKCYLRVWDGTNAVTIVGQILIFRNPCYHPGDIVLLDAIDVAKMRHMCDVIVFSTEGRRPACDMCSGGDLDGDKFHVVWDQEIVSCLTQAAPFDYRPEIVEERIKEIIIKLGITSDGHLPDQNRSKRSTPSAEGTASFKTKIIESLVTYRNDYIVGRVDSLLREFQTFQHCETSQSRLCRSELMDLLTALFSASIDSLGIDLETLFVAVRKEIASSRNSALSSFRKVSDICYKQGDTSAEFVRLERSDNIVFPLFYDSTTIDNRVATENRNLDLKTYQPERNGEYRNLKERLLHLGKLPTYTAPISLLSEDCLGLLQRYIKTDALSECVEAISSLEHSIQTLVDEIEVIDLTREDSFRFPSDAVDFLKRHGDKKSAFDHLFDLHRSFSVFLGQLVTLVRNKKSDFAALSEAAQILENETTMLKRQLPVYGSRSTIIECLAKHRMLLILSETGSGKSTCTPNFVANDLFINNALSPSKLIVVAQPRRNATTELARHIAQDRKSAIGEAVGYHIGKRGARVIKNRTIISCVTYGILLSYARRDPALRGFSVIILDEVHESSSDLCFLFGVLKIALARNPELKVILMSASVDFSKITAFFPECQIITVEGRSFPVEEYFVGKLSYTANEYIPNAVVQSLRIHATYPVGDNPDILVFVPTRRDIALGIELLKEYSRSAEELKNIIPLPFHSRMSESRKDFILKRKPLSIWSDLNFKNEENGLAEFDFEESEDPIAFEENMDGELVESSNVWEDESKIRRIIFCTNIAETSLTIPKIGYVVDCGLQYSVEHTPIMKIQKRWLVPTTKVQAVQRMGRAGRVAPGICFRMYSLQEQEDLVSQQYMSPERFDIQLLHIVEIFGDIRKFEWFRAPHDSELGWTYSYLTSLRLLDHSEVTSDQVVTADGKFALELDRLEVPANIAVFLLRIWKRFPGQDTMSKVVKQFSLAIAACLSVNSGALFTSKFKYRKILDAGFDLYFRSSNDQMLPSTFIKVNLYYIWLECPLKANFCKEFGVSLTGFETIYEVYEELYWIMEDRFTRGMLDSNFPSKSFTAKHHDEISEALLNELQIVCFSNLAYLRQERDSLNAIFVLDSKKGIAVVDPRESEMFAWEALHGNRLVLFHEIRSQQDATSDASSQVFIGQLDPIPWTWPKNIPDEYLVKYLQIFPDFPSPS